MKEIQLAASVSFSTKEPDARKKRKAALIALPVLVITYSGDKLTMDTDAPNIQFDCILLQKPSKDTPKSICCWL